MLAGKSRGGTPFCRMLKTVFPKSRIFCKVIFRCNCSPGTVTRYIFLIQVSQGGAVLFAPPRKAVAFLTTRSVCQKHGTGISLPAACFRNTTRIRFGKAGAHPQLALGIAIAPETLFYHYSLLIFEGNCDSFDSLLDFCCNLSCSLICSANVGCSPTPRQHF